MTTKNNALSAYLTDKRISRDHRNFNLSGPFWQLNKDVRIGLEWTKSMNKDIRLGYLETLAHYAENYSADHTKNMNALAKMFFNHTKKYDINPDSLISYRSTLDKSTEHHLGALRGFLRKWNELGYPGVSDEVIELVSNWRLKGNEKGRAVSLMDPNTGPLSDIEMDALLTGLLDGYMRGSISLESYAVVSTLAHSGRRSTQVVSLKIKDVISISHNGEKRFAINFPRAKQRHIGWRVAFNAYPITEDLALLLNLQSETVKKKVQRKTGLKLSSEILRELPLFPNIESFNAGVSEKELMEQLKFDLHHAERNVCNGILKRVLKLVTIRSERTGEQIKVTTKRFRYTLGTNLAREGKGEYVIAEALDHSDTQNSGVYIDNIPDIVERIDKAVAMQLAPLAQAFQGVLIASEDQAVRGNDKSSRISNGKANLGNCGSFGFCGALAPVACYTCTHFQPWLDGPHEQVLDELISKRDEILDLTTDKKVAAINDRLILAVSDVIQRCQRLQAKVNEKELSDG